MKKILFCTKYERLGASSRLRTFQFLPFLMKDFDCIVNSLFSNQYVQNIYTRSKQNKLLILYAYIKRFLFIMTSSADIIVIEKELFPYLPAFFEKMCLWKRKYIIDIDDAVFHNYNLNKNYCIKNFLSNKFNSLFRNSTYVLAGSPYLEEEAENFGAEKVIYYPTVIDLARYSPVNYINKDCTIIGWIGTNGTVKYLDLIIPILDDISCNITAPFKILIIGADKKFNVKNLKIEYAKWTEETEVDLINLLDIGIMPLHDTPWERGKCAYKLIQYMGCAKPVIATAIGANNLVVDESCGFLCSNHDDWHNAFLTLIDNFTLRQELGRNGRKKIEKNYNINSNLMIFRSLINEIA